MASTSSRTEAKHFLRGHVRCQPLAKRTKEVGLLDVLLAAQRRERRSVAAHSAIAGDWLSATVVDRLVVGRLRLHSADAWLALVCFKYRSANAKAMLQRVAIEQRLQCARRS